VCAGQREGNNGHEEPTKEDVHMFARTCVPNEQETTTKPRERPTVFVVPYIFSDFFFFPVFISTSLSLFFSSFFTYQ